MGRYKSHRPRGRHEDDNYSSPDWEGGNADHVLVSAVEVIVTWFDQSKGYGFVKAINGSDAFLHVRQLEAAGHSSVAEGARLKVRIEQGQKGQQVAEVLELEAPPPTDLPPPRTLHAQQSIPETTAQGTVKWYNVEKGFGFIELKNGEGDVFVHATTLTRSDLTSLKEGQAVSVTFVTEKKGPEARSIRLLSQ